MQSLVWLSDSPTIATGFGRVTRQVLGLLGERVEDEITCLGWGYRGTAEAAASLPYTMIPQGDLGSGADNLPRVLSTRQGSVLSWWLRGAVRDVLEGESH